MILNHIQVCNYSESKEDIWNENFFCDNPTLSKETGSILSCGLLNENYPSEREFIFNDNIGFNKTTDNYPNISIKESSEEPLTSLDESQILFDKEKKVIVVESKKKKTKQIAKRNSARKIFLRKGKFSAEEDNLLKSLVKKHGKNWSLISKLMDNKERKQVRERYENFLCKKIIRKRFTPEEDAKILELLNKIGKKFYAIADEFVGRTAIMIKNRYYSKLLKETKPN